MVLSGHAAAAGPFTGHALWVRISHWIVTASVSTLVFSGFEILMVHPRLYWGEVGNDLTPAWIELPISRNYKHDGWGTPVPFFDNAAGAQVPSCALAAITDHLIARNVQRGGPYGRSQEVDAMIARAREAVAAFVNARAPEEIAFGLNATSFIRSISLAIGQALGDRTEIIVTAPIIASPKVVAPETDLACAAQPQPVQATVP